MGRGLSELQRWILREARKRDRLYYTEICLDYYGWEPKKQFQRDVLAGKRDDLLAQGTRPSAYLGMGGQVFDRSAIGAREYGRVMATISRSCRRLEDRGLVRRLEGRYARWAAVEATEGGDDE